MNEVSNFLACFRQEAPEQSKAWLERVTFATLPVALTVFKGVK